MLTVRQLLKPDEVAAINERLAAERFIDGVETAKGRAKEVKNNLQIPYGGDVGRELDPIVRAAFERSEAVRAMVLPLYIQPTRFARYEPGMAYGWHVDGAVMAGADGRPIRSDLACTIFLADPASYGGGELTVQTPVGHVRAKLPAGDAVIYPATFVHRVEAVTHGVRLVAVTWLQSMVASAEQRQLLIELYQATRDIGMRDPEAPEIDRLIGVHANLVRMWGHT